MPFLEDSAAPPSAPHEFHASLGDEDKTPQAETATVSRPPAEEQIARAIQYVGAYLRQQRDYYYFPVALPLSNQHKASMGPYFSAALLDRVRIVELKGQRVSSPWFYAEARALGFDHLPALTHMDSVTYLDVVVFNEMLTGRPCSTAWCMRCSLMSSVWSAIPNSSYSSSCGRKTISPCL